MPRRLAYSEISEIYKYSWEAIKGIKGIIWLGTLMIMVTGVPGAILAALHSPKILSSLVTGFGHILSLMLMASMISLVKKWIEKKQKSFDDLFVYMTEWSSIKRIIGVIIFGGILSIVNIWISPVSKEISGNTFRLIGQLIASTLLIINYYVLILKVFQDVSALEAWRQVLAAFLKNIDVLIVFSLLTALLYIVATAFTLMIGIIWLVPLSMGMYYVAYKKIFEATPL